MVPWLADEPLFPPLRSALDEPNGLLAAGGELNPIWLRAAYRQGIFPWFSGDQPILWWSPDPRLVLHTDRMTISRSLRKTLARAPFEIRVDTAFEAVMRACAAPREEDGGTWIVEPILNAYCGLHREGFAHSVEAWAEGELVGGLYGVALGRMFFGESMFARRTDASKVALAHLVCQLQRWGFPMIDCQQETAHLQSLGAATMPRKDFARRIRELVDLVPLHASAGGVGKPGAWTFDPDLFPTPRP